MVYMTPDSPDEALHFRGKTLTPESPRPLHVAEPANIPVLQNQMDPVFNDTSTYDRAESSASESHRILPGEPYTGSVGGNTGPAEGGRQQQSHIQGSIHSGPLLVNDRLVDAKSDTAPSTTAATAAIPSLPDPYQPTNSAKLSSSCEATTDASLTVSPPSDPSSLPAHPVPGAPTSSSHAAHGPSLANEVDHSAAALQAQLAPQSRLDADKSEDNGAGNGVDFQTLLDNLPSSSTAPSISTVPGSTIPADGASASSQTTADEALQSSLSLPPRPPPQEKPSIHPNYNPSDDIRSYHQLPAHTSSTAHPYASQQSNYQSNAGISSLAASGAPGTTTGASALPPPPVPSFQQSPSASVDKEDASDPGTHKNGRIDRQPTRSDEDTPWGPEVQKKYDEFLRDERVYVTEGLWDRFPYGSRLFVGNLPTERVTKRDLFHIFHSYGKLAQISIKQAYGFIQFLEAPACKRALECEQGVVVRGRKVHLEISKPQRNTRPAPATAESSRAPPPHRSRSPDYGRGGTSNRSARSSRDRYEQPHEPGRLPFSDFRDDHAHRRRDDYRPPRSPSPRGYRAREEYRSRDRTPERFERRERRRSRSPYARDRRYRTPSPRGRATYDGDADLPVPRRAARDVPDVQILVLEELDRNFIYHVESTFRNRGLRVDVLVLGPRIPLDAAVKRQISEGVLAVVRLSRPSQFARKIPLQVFDRSSGVDNVRSNEYPDLEPNIAAEIVFQAQTMQRSGPSVPFAPAAYGVPAMPSAHLPHPPVPAVPAQPNLANAISTLDGPALQTLLAALQQQRPPAVQPAQQPFSTTTNPLPTPDLASLLSAATRQPAPTNIPQPPVPPQPFPIQAPNAAAVSDPNLLSLLAKGLGGQQPQAQAAMPPHVQNIMSQLSKWKQ